MFTVQKVMHVYFPRRFPELHHLLLLLWHEFNWVSIFHDWEIKVSYFPDTKYCYTFHVMDNSGESVSVTKRCVPLEDCLLTGCAEVTENGYQVRSSSVLIKLHPCPWLIFFFTFSCSDVLVLLRGQHLQHAGAPEREQRHLFLHLAALQLWQRAPPRSAGLRRCGCHLPCGGTPLRGKTLHLEAQHINET